MWIENDLVVGGDQFFIGSSSFDRDLGGLETPTT